MKRSLFKAVVCSTIALGFVTEAVATEWNVSLWGKRRAFTEGVEKLAEIVDKKSAGSFKLKISYGGLSKPKENLDGIAIGAFEIAQFCSFYHKKKNPTITVTELPFGKNQSLANITKIYQKVFENPIVVKDLARWNATLLMPTPLPQYNIVSKTEPLKSLDDFKGMRIRGPGGIMGVLSKLGAIKTGVTFSETRQAMDSGVIDAATFAPHAHLATKTFKVGKWASTNLNLGSANCPVVVNSNALKALSAKEREILLGSVDEAMAHYVDNYDNKTTAAFEKALKEKGLKQVTLSAEQTAKLSVLAKSVREGWVKKYAGQFDSKALFDLTNGLFSK